MKMSHTLFVLTTCLLILGSLACGEGRKCAVVREIGLEDWAEQLEILHGIDAQCLYDNVITGDQSYPREVMYAAISRCNEQGIDIRDGLAVPPEYRCPITGQLFSLTAESRNGNFTLIMSCPQHGQSEVVVRLDG